MDGTQYINIKHTYMSFVVVVVVVYAVRKRTCIRVASYITYEFPMCNDKSTQFRWKIHEIRKRSRNINLIWKFAFSIELNTNSCLYTQFVCCRGGGGGGILYICMWVRNKLAHMTLCKALFGKRMRISRAQCM